MAITTYTFPNQIIPSGTLSFEVKTSDGAGGTVDVDAVYGEKYFSSDIVITKETEFVGGDIVSDTVALKVENDKDNLFSNTIFPYSYVEGGWVSIKITLGTTILFSGILNKSSIRYTSYYANNDALSGQLKSISFNCIWYLELLKNITGEQLGTFLVSDTEYHIPLPKISTAYSGVGSGLKVATVMQIAKGCLAKLASDYGLTINVVIPQIDYVFYTRNPQYELGEFVFPPVDTDLIVPNETRTQYDSIGMTLDNSPAILLTDGLGDLTGRFNEDDDNYIENAYDFFVGVLKSFALFVNPKVNADYNLFAEIGTRSSGEPAVISDVLEHSDILFSELSRDGVEIRSNVDGTEYKKQFNTVGDSIYSNSNEFNFNNPTEFPGGNDTNALFNSSYSLMYPTPAGESNNGQGVLLLLTALGVGANQISNPNFETDLDGWTTTDFAWSNNTFFPVGAALADTSSVTAQYISYDTSGLLTGNIVLLRDKLIFSMNAYVNGTHVITIEWYNGTTLYSTDSFTGVQTGLRKFYSILDAGNVNKIQISALAGTPGATCAISFTQLRRYRPNTPELYGKLIEKYFNNSAIKRRSLLVNGIETAANLSDYVIFDGVKYYIKKVEYNLSENETQVEVANYPY